MHDRYIAVFLKIMFVREAFECSFDHPVLKVFRVHAEANLNGQLLIHAKVFGTPGDSVAGLAKAGGSACHNRFMRLFCGNQVEVNTPGKVKNQFSWRIDSGSKLDDGHEFVENREGYFKATRPS